MRKLTRKNKRKMETIRNFTTINSDPVYSKLNTELTWSYKVIDKFIYSLSHEFRGPLKSIEGLVKLLNMTVQGSEERNCLNFIETAATNLEQCLDKLEQDVEMTRSITNHEPMIIEEHIERILRGYAPEIAEKGIRVQVESNQKSPFYCEVERLNLAIQNVINNAITFSDEAKENKIISVGIHVNKDQCSITVADNGIGIEQGLLDRVFEPFYKGTNKSKGIGVGLYLAKKSIRKIGGEIRVQSLPGRGTAITMECPNQVL